MNLGSMAGLASILIAASPVAGADWAPAKGPLMTRWAKDVNPERVHAEYPRPNMVRGEWRNLNGLWDYAIRPKTEDRPQNWDGQILVPFPVESALSGVMKAVGKENRLWYRRTFRYPNAAAGGRLLLHFGAVDWHAVVWVGGKRVGEHKGGYTPFTFDVTDALTDAAAGGEQELVVSVWDPTDSHWQPRGKQVAEPRGIWYTAVTGIWQTVWLEWVPAVHIESLKIVPAVDKGLVTITAVVPHARPGDRVVVAVTATDDAKPGPPIAEASGKPNQPINVPIKNARLWSPDNPHLYGLRATLTNGERESTTVDRVRGYFGMRKIEIRRDEDGFNRLFLNNKPLFQFGPLDQGWWPDGLYTAPTDAALRYDVETTKKLGFNMCRKHVKVEPPRWYYWCDKLGLMVWQDMPSGDRHIGGDQPDLERSAESASNYRREWKEVIDARRNHPAIVAWVPFNEGWGQFDTSGVLAWTKKYDPGRLVDGPSGWTDRGTGDMHDMHRYPGPAMPQPEETRAAVLGEFGGLGLPLEGHLWRDKQNWGYRTYKTKEELRQNYDQLIQRLRPLISRGLAAAVYTQTTDVEGEVNGLMTYDRLLKFDADHLANLHAKLYLPPPIIITRVVVPTSRGEGKGQSWRYTTSQPAAGWQAPDFDDSAWQQGRGGFGEPSTPGAVVRTKWKSKQIWLRRTFELKQPAFSNPHLRIHHDEDADVYLNGRKVAALKGYTTEYVDYELDADGRRALRAGVNTIAVYCSQTVGGQYIDVGLLDVIEKPRPAGNSDEQSGRKDSGDFRKSPESCLRP